MRFSSKGRRDKGGQPQNEILSEKDFYHLLEGERARAERYQHAFSLIVFKQAHSTNGVNGLRAFASNLAQRRRKSDIVGWMATDRLGVILPLTSPVRARIAAERLFGMASPQSLAYQIMTYPPIESNSTDKPDDSTGGSQREHEGMTQSKDHSSNKTDSSMGSSRSDNEETSRPKSMAPVSSAITLSGEFPVSQDESGIDELLAPDFPFWKRALDIAIASTGLVLLSPLFLIVSLLIKTTSSGPIFFKQERVGRLGKKFTCWKFRTMKHNTDVAIHKKYLTQLISSGEQMTKLDLTHDPRLIPCARFLRAMGIDELPQLFNVLRGEMSFIGPRPCIQYEYVQFKPWQKRRFDERPGLTGLWQVSGKNSTTFEDMMRLDISYGRGKSFWNDLNIIIKTFPAVAKEVERVRSRRKKPI
jgi:lipopolysaccharide/colanic/teichoic acid biosynthesis glycosyltransferase